MKKLLLSIAIVVLSFSSCYEDAKPIVSLSIEGINSQNRSVDGNLTAPLYDYIDTLHLAIYKSSNLSSPLSVASINRGTPSIFMTAPLGDVTIVLWAAGVPFGSSETIVQFYGTTSLAVTTGNNVATLSLTSITAGFANFNMSNQGDHMYLYWDKIPNASYTLENSNLIEGLRILDAGENNFYNDYNYESGYTTYYLKIKSIIFNVSTDDISTGA